MGKTKSFRIQNEILDRKHLEKIRAFFSPNSVKTSKGKLKLKKTKNDAGVSHRNWKTNTSNKDNS